MGSQKKRGQYLEIDQKVEEVKKWLKKAEKDLILREYLEAK